MHLEIQNLLKKGKKAKKKKINKEVGMKMLKLKMILPTNIIEDDVTNKNCHNPTQQQLNLTRLRLDIIIKPNPPTPPQPHKLAKIAIGREDSGTIDRGFSLVESLHSYH